MSKGWKIIGGVVLVLILLGAICIGVGFMTGGDLVDIYSALNAKFRIVEYWDAWSDWAAQLFNNIWEGIRQLW